MPWKDSVGQSLFDVFHPDDRERVRQQIMDCLRNPNEMVHLEAKKRRKDGSILWVREFARAVQNVDRSFVILLVCNDVTEEIKAQEALSSSEAELRALFASMQNRFWSSIGTATIAVLLQPIRKKSTFNPMMSSGSIFSALFPENKVVEFLEVMAQVLDTGETVHLGSEIAVNGQSPWFESSVSPMGEDMTIWVARDISERKEMKSAAYSVRTGVSNVV